MKRGDTLQLYKIYNFSRAEEVANDVIKSLHPNNRTPERCFPVLRKVLIPKFCDSVNFKKTGVSYSVTVTLKHISKTFSVKQKDEYNRFEGESILSRNLRVLLNSSIEELSRTLDNVKFDLERHPFYNMRQNFWGGGNNTPVTSNDPSVRVPNGYGDWAGNLPR